jgi:hypothetical protein
MKTKPVINYPLTTTDSKGNTVYFEASNWYKSWSEYDDKNNRHYRDSDGFEAWYDSKGYRIPNPNLTTTVDEIAKNFKPVINYPLTTTDSKGNTIHVKFVSISFGTVFEYWQEFNENNKLIHSKDSKGTEFWWDSEGHSIPDPNLVKEVTLEDIAEKFGVSVEQIKIKK